MSYHENDLTCKYLHYCKGATSGESENERFVQCFGLSVVGGHSISRQCKGGNHQLCGGGNGSGFVVFYDSSAGACTVGNPYQASSTALDDITLFSQDAAAIVHSAANVGTGAGTNNTDHNGCNLQGTAITAGNACSRITGALTQHLPIQ